MRPAATLSQSGLVESWIPAPAELTNAAAGFEPPPRGLREPAQIELPPAAALIEGWASAAASSSRAILASAASSILTNRPIWSGAGQARVWAQVIFDALEASGLLSRRVPLSAQRSEMPASDAALTSFAGEHPDRAAELLLAASVGASLRDFGSGNGSLAGASDAAREAFDLRSASAVAAAKGLCARLELLLEGRNGSSGSAHPPGWLRALDNDRLSPCSPPQFTAHRIRP